ncbi:hypothetical protein ABB29_01980 [Pseudoxanthomonas dokdonensis]|uniref:Uncharacterized protein n=1 Tax=Pseudoxanthomonas dokdonensis TaxID=344882 RepID=A0A0R0CP23_9GAMM|nr:hypothetical protein ABB29_01980 [Pseudoxanthomonas dokdonensis]
MKLRQRLLPEELQLGWMPFYNLGYLLFLFLPALFAWLGERDGYLGPLNLGYTLLSVLVFLPIYFMSYRGHPAVRFAGVLAMGLIGYTLMPHNAFANTYLIYAASFIPYIGMPLSRGVLLMLCQLVVMLLQLMWLGYPLFIFGLTLLISVSAFFGNHFYVQNRHKQAALKLSDDEIRRLAATAERERIGRDLHDLLGHTLSLVALKSELAGKLLDRDLAAARREMDEVSRVARDALSQVRRAVSGIRAAGLAAELASARVLLETDGVALQVGMDEVELDAAAETVLALVLREAVTNIQRHARARQVRVSLQAAEDNGVALLVEDDGRGQPITPGNGVAGMRERLATQGGRLQLTAQAGRGVRLRAWLPGSSSLRAAGLRAPDQPLPQ